MTKHITKSRLRWTLLITLAVLIATTSILAGVFMSPARTVSADEGVDPPGNDYITIAANSELASDSVIDFFGSTVRTTTTTHGLTTTIEGIPAGLIGNVYFYLFRGYLPSLPEDNLLLFDPVRTHRNQGNLGYNIYWENLRYLGVPTGNYTIFVRAIVRQGAFSLPATRRGVIFFNSDIDYARVYVDNEPVFRIAGTDMLYTASGMVVRYARRDGANSSRVGIPIRIDDGIAPRAQAPGIMPLSNTGHSPFTDDLGERVSLIERTIAGNRAYILEHGGGYSVRSAGNRDRLFMLGLRPNTRHNPTNEVVDILLIRTRMPSVILYNYRYATIHGHEIPLDYLISTRRLTMLGTLLIVAGVGILGGGLGLVLALTAVGINSTLYAWRVRPWGDMAQLADEIRFLAEQGLMFDGQMAIGPNGLPLQCPIGNWIIICRFNNQLLDMFNYPLVCYQRARPLLWDGYRFTNYWGSPLDIVLGNRLSYDGVQVVSGNPRAHEPTLIYKLVIYRMDAYGNRTRYRFTIPGTATRLSPNVYRYYDLNGNVLTGTDEFFPPTDSPITEGDWTYQHPDYEPSPTWVYNLPSWLRRAVQGVRNFFGLRDLFGLRNPSLDYSIAFAILIGLFILAIIGAILAIFILILILAALGYLLATFAPVLAPAAPGIMAFVGTLFKGLFLGIKWLLIWPFKLNKWFGLIYYVVLFIIILILIAVL